MKSVFLWTVLLKWRRITKKRTEVGGGRREDANEEKKRCKGEEGRDGEKCKAELKGARQAEKKIKKAIE